MSQKTGIQWTDATWNPVTGCTKVSRGCDNCYAHTLAHRLLADIYGARPPVIKSARARRDPFAVRLWPERLTEPARWRRPRRVFVNSMSDLFHTDVPDAFVRRIFEVMMAQSQHTFQVLTKRPARARRFWIQNRDLFDNGAIPAHIWIGTSIEEQRVDHRLRQLVSVPAQVRFLSCEPLLGPLELDLTEISWVIVGGESGLNHRPMDSSWASAIRNQCVRAGVPFFFKQVGGRTPKAGGRELDGQTWDEYPELPVARSI